MLAFRFTGPSAANAAANLYAKSPGYVAQQLGAFSFSATAENGLSSGPVNSRGNESAFSGTAIGVVIALAIIALASVLVAIVAVRRAWYHASAHREAIRGFDTHASRMNSGRDMSFRDDSRRAAPPTEALPSEADADLYHPLNS